MASERKPRLCVMTKGDKGYGFHLHGEKGKTGQYIRKVEPDSPAEEAGLRAGDRVVAVNGVNVERETHHQVVQRIKAVDKVTRLLVVDQETHECLRNLRLTPTEEMAVPGAEPPPPFTPPPPPQSTPSPSPSVPSSPGKKKRENGSVSLQSMLQRSQSCQAQKPTGRITSPAVKKAVQTQVEEAPTTTHQARSRLHGDPTEFAPRLCHLVRADTRYGFNLHSHRSRPGQYIRLLDAGSPADQAGLRPQDRIVEVNGVNVEVMRHSEVVAFIKKGGDETWLLVVDPDTDEYFKMKGITPTVSHVKDYSGPYVSKSSPSPLTNGSSSPHSFRSKNSVRSNGRQAAGKERGRYSDPFADIGLNATAAEVKRKLTAKEKRKAPEMDWMKKYELFSNF